MQIVLDAQGRVVASSMDTFLADGIEIELPEGFDPEHQHDWRLEDGTLVYDPLPEDPSPTLSPLEILEARMDEMVLVVADMIGGALE